MPGSCPCQNNQNMEPFLPLQLCLLQVPGHEAQPSMQGCIPTGCLSHTESLAGHQWKGLHLPARQHSCVGKYAVMHYESLHTINVYPRLTYRGPTWTLGESPLHPIILDFLPSSSSSSFFD